MDPIILIIKYLFNKKNHNIKFDSVESFFEDGISFPKFICLILNIKKIPHIKNHPRTKNDRKRNNKLAFEYLCNNIEIIREAHPRLESLNDKTNLLILILTKKCFILDDQKILNICNMIVKPKSLYFKNENDLIKPHNLMIIINMLTNNQDAKIPLCDDYIIDFLPKIFEQAKVPYVVNSNSFTNPNQYQFYIQLLIMFDFFNDKFIYDEDPNDSENMAEKSDKINFFSDFFNHFRKKTNSIDEYSSDSTDYYSDDEDEIEYENLQNEALLKTINAIGSKSGFYFESFVNAVKNDNIPKFVMSFFNINSIENVHITDTPDSETGSEALNETQITNIDAVIEFLKKKKEKFKFLLFDFEDFINIEISAIHFYSNFLNCFFINKVKKEMYIKIAELLCSHTSRFDNNYNPHLFTKYRIYPCLLHFINVGNLHFDFNYKKVKFRDPDVEPYFKKAKIPMIINKLLLSYSKQYVSYVIFYQLQFIFEELDKVSSSHKIVGNLMKSLFKIKSVKVPKFSDIKTNIKVKRQSSFYRNIINTKYQNKADMNIQNYEKKKEKKPIINPKSFKTICKENNEILNEMNNLIQSQMDDSIEKEPYMTFDDFWNDVDINYKNDNGIIYNSKNREINKIQKDWIDEIQSIQKNIKKKDQITQIQNMNGNLKAFEQRRSLSKSKLYKLFIYDEKNSKWNFMSSNFSQFSKDKRINVDCSKTPLVLLFNSFENDIISISSKFINSFHPFFEIDENSNEFFIYALCDRSLSMLNYNIDFNNTEKLSIKPIFLIPHIPKTKENHTKIRLILTQIYSFLSSICDLEITILNKTHYIDQIEFIENIIKINKNYNEKTIKNTTSDEITFSFEYQSPSSHNDCNIKDSNSLFKYKEPRFFFLVNDPSIENEIDYKSIKNNFFMNLLSIINLKYLCYINIENINTYECFLTLMNDIIIDNYSTFSDINEKFKFIDGFCCTEKFIQLIIKDDYYDDLEKLIFKRLRMLKSNENLSKSYELVLVEEIQKAIPKCNKDFIADCMKIKNICKFCNEKTRNFLKENLKVCSDSHLLFISQSIDQKFFLEYKKMANMVDSHKKFLKYEFFSMIASIFSNKTDIFYELNFDIVERQLKRDESLFMEMFEPFIRKIHIKNQTKFCDVKNSMVEGTNYVMKEVENLKEITVSVQINKDLKSVIPQDF